MAIDRPDEFERLDLLSKMLQASKECDNMHLWSEVLEVAMLATGLMTDANHTGQDHPEIAPIFHKTYQNDPEELNDLRG